MKIKINLPNLSKDFYVTVILLLILFTVFLLMPPIKRTFSNVFQNDSGIIKQYYKAINRKDYKTAYSLLANLTLKYKTDEGKKLEFNIKPDYKKFVKDHEKVKSVKVIKVRRENKYCYPEVGLRCFKVEAAINYKDLIVSPGGKTIIYIYTLNTGNRPLILGIRTTP